MVCQYGKPAARPKSLLPKSSFRLLQQDTLFQQDTTERPGRKGFKRSVEGVFLYEGIFFCVGDQRGHWICPLNRTALNAQRD